MQQMLRVAIYARVSSDQQSGDNTIASQVTALQARVSADGLVLPRLREKREGRVWGW